VPWIKLRDVPVQVINTCREWEGATGNGQLVGNGWKKWYKSLNNLPPEGNRDGQDPTVLYYALAPQSCNNGLGPDADACYSALFNILDECVERTETGNIGDSYGGHYRNDTCFEYGIGLSWEELLSKSVLAHYATGSSGTPSLSGLIPLAIPTDGPASSSPAAGPEPSEMLSATTEPIVTVSTISCADARGDRCLPRATTITAFA